MLKLLTPTTADRFVIVFVATIVWLVPPSDRAFAQQEHRDSKVAVADQKFVSLRGNLQNSLHKFEVGKTGRVAFLGGSITEMNGYRPMVCEWLSARFPDTDFTFINAGISSTCSHAGAFRVFKDVLAEGPVDLLFVEFAVNDDQDAGHTAEGCVQGMEGIVRQVRSENPNADMVMTHFVNEGMIETLNAGKTILSASQHERVASHYNVSSSYLCKEVASRLRSQAMTWKEYGGTHPKKPGNRLAADQVISIMKAGWKTSDPTTPGQPHPMPPPLNTDSFSNGRLLSPAEAANTHGWTFVEPDWDNIPGNKRDRYLNRRLLQSQTPAATTTYNFQGTAIGAFLVAGPDAGRLEVRVDEADWKTVELYHRYSRNLHYPRLVMFFDQLSSGPHRLEMKVSGSRHSNSSGHAVRILSMAVNQNADSR